jgi:hypothetical protein
MVYSNFLFLQQLFVGVWVAGSVALFGLPKFFVVVLDYISFFSPTIVCWWVAGSVALFFRVISFSDVSS